jgi:hypothetical protein
MFCKKETTPPKKKKKKMWTVVSFHVGHCCGLFVAGIAFFLKILETEKTSQCVGPFGAGRAPNGSQSPPRLLCFFFLCKPRIFSGRRAIKGKRPRQKKNSQTKLKKRETIRLVVGRYKSLISRKKF